MSKLIVIDGTTVSFDIKGPSFLGPTQTTIAASGAATVAGTKVCVQGDEGGVELKIDYTMGPFSIPGNGSMTIMQLLPDQIASKTNSAGKAVLLQGSSFVAIFQVQVPATNPAGAPDPLPMYVGIGTFEDNNTLFSGT